MWRAQNVAQNVSQKVSVALGIAKHQSRSPYNLSKVQFKCDLLKWQKTFMTKDELRRDMDKNNDQKIYRINSTRTNFIYTSDTPEEENIVYNR